MNDENKKVYLTPLHNSSRSKSPSVVSSIQKACRNTDNIDDFIRVSSDDESDYNFSYQKSNSREYPESLSSNKKTLRFNYSQDYSNRLEVPSSQKIGKSRENYLNEITEESQNSGSDSGTNSESSRKVFDYEDRSQAEYKPKTGIEWSDKCDSLEEFARSYKSSKRSNTQIVKAQCSRPDCRCAFRNGESLMLFPMMDSYIAYATWEKALPSSALTSNRNSQVINRSTADNSSPLESSDFEVYSECQAKLMLFKQCKGWYEILNENNVAVPFYTSVEQIKRCKPDQFLTRTKLKVLVAPSNLNGSKAEIIQAAQMPEVISESQLSTVATGTIFRFLEYLPNCRVSLPGRRPKIINLLFVIEKKSGSLDPECSNQFQRFVYIGTEEPSRDSYFPSKLSLSTIAGPENISGVHTIGNILKKFRLPVSVRPVAVTDTSSSPSNAYKSKKEIEFPLMKGLVIGDRHFLRIKSIYCCDLLLLSTMKNPERIYIITPNMLPDHKFYSGITEDRTICELTRHYSIHVSEFLSLGHSLASMKYLIKNLEKSRYLVKYYRSNNNTNLSREEILRAYKANGHDPRVGPGCLIPPDVVDKEYEEINEIYFFIRNGFYPSKPAIQTNQNSSEDRSKRYLDNNKPSQQKPIVDSSRLGLKSADQLLAESLFTDHGI